MNLIIDCGNTNLKYFIYKDEKLISKNLFRWEDDWKSKLKKNFPHLKNILLCDVTGKYHKVDLEKNFPDKKIYEVKALYFPFKTNYNYKNLGDDRIGLITAAINKFPKEDCLVIDAGTCLTFDLISSKSFHEGGLISPGLLIRFKILNQYTSSLPFIDFKDKKVVIGNDTKSSIHGNSKLRGQLLFLINFLFEI